jgi:hypothetical protein
MKRNPKADNKATELFKHTFFLVGDQREKDRLWAELASDQFKDVMGRLIVFHANQILYADPSVRYSEDFKQKLSGIIGEALGLGYFIHYVDITEMQGLEAEKYNDPGLKDFLMAKIEVLEDEREVPADLEPPTYVFETFKMWFNVFIKHGLTHEAVVGLESDKQKEFLLTKYTWLIALGYLMSVLQKQYHESRVPDGSAK